MGDFNVVRRFDERFNSLFCSRSARDFNLFIHQVGLTDLKMGGHRFTCFCNRDSKLSKLDRFLVCLSLIDLIPSISVTTLPRKHSDHYPILLSSTGCDFGPQPFKLFNPWMLREGFELVFIKAWNNFKGFGNPYQYLAVKLKHVKEELER